MARVSDTSIVRDYCLSNKGGVFDLNYLASNVFRDIPHVNLRKIVTRLIESSLLRQISKGVYLIGESEQSDEERLLKHYLFDGNVRVGMETGAFLFYRLGLRKIEPEEKIIRTSKTVGNKKIGNMQVIETKGDIAEGALHTYELEVVLEIFENARFIDEEFVGEATRLVEKHLKSYYKDFVFKHLAIDHPKIVYIDLANMLDSMQISHKVLDIYVEKTRVSNL